MPSASVLIMATFGGLVAIVFFVKRPGLGPLALLVACLAVPFDVGTGTGTRLGAGVLLLALLLALWLLQAVAKGSSRTFTSATVPPLILFIFAATIAYLLGLRPWIPFAETASIAAQTGGLAIFVISAGAFLLVAYRLPSLRSLQTLTWVFFILGGLYVAGRAFSPLGRIAGLYGSPGSLFWTWLAVLAFAQAVYNRSAAPRTRLIALGITGITLAIALGQNRDWVSGWLPPLTAIALTIWAANPRLAFLLALIGGTVGAAIGPLIYDVVLGSGSDNEYSLVTRLEAWRVLWQIFQISPLIGIGPSNYYFYTPLFPILGYAVSFNSHNNYVDLVLQTGLIGLACYGWFFAVLGLVGWQLRAVAPPGFARAYVYSAIGGIGGTLVAGMLGDWVLPFVYNIGYVGLRSSLLGWIFLGGLVAIQRIVAKSGQHAENSPSSDRMPGRRHRRSSTIVRDGRSAQPAFMRHRTARRQVTTEI